MITLIDVGCTSSQMLTLRHLFVMHAMQGLLAAAPEAVGISIWRARVPEVAVEVADATIAAMMRGEPL